MDLRTKYEAAKTTLGTHNQQHLLNFWQRLDENQQKSLIEQINDLDLEKIDRWIKDVVKNPEPLEVPTEFDPAPYYPALPMPDMEQKYALALEKGRNLIREGKVAAFVVAGGQGTRLGFDGPKGDFPVTAVKNKTLFRLFAESIIAVSQKYNAAIPWYIMTSPLNHLDTVEIFKKNHYFGLNPADFFIFQQGTLPNFAFDGEILMADKDTIAQSPDGHGGSLRALYRSGAVEDMKKRGIEYISYFQIDNPLVKVIDPLFIGLHAINNAQMSSKALKKNSPTEKVGNFCLVNDRVTVIEYSDLPDEQANRINPDGSLVFELGSIAIHIINTDFVESLNKEGFSLPLHKAIKKIAHIDYEGNQVEPKEPNGVKLETFVFDALPLAEKSVIFETLREEEFAPVKNATGVDSAESSRQLQIARAAAWLELAGVKIPRKADGSLDCVIEIAPSFAVEKEEIVKNKNRLPKINPGDKVYID
ncbi:MAG: UDPGP type 1 family protein [Phycisphaerae bacterium]|nr:UDPGP type 1 family protein [Phycisphaerae bacterium]